MNFTLEKNIIGNKLQKAVKINSLQELNDYLLTERPMLFNAAGDIHYTYKDAQAAGFFEVWAHYTENGTQSQIDRCAGISDAKVGKVTTAKDAVIHPNPDPNPPRFEGEIEGEKIKISDKPKGGRPKKETV